jgi:hypothetical protein
VVFAGTFGTENLKVTVVPSYTFFVSPFISGPGKVVVIVVFGRIVTEVISGGSTWA